MFSIAGVMCFNFLNNLLIKSVGKMNILSFCTFDNEDIHIGFYVAVTRNILYYDSYYSWLLYLEANRAILPITYPITLSTL